MKYNIIVSINKDNVIGYNNNLLIKSKEDLNYFYKITTEKFNDYQNVCIMGWGTWASIPEEVRPLKNRINIVITKNHCAQGNVVNVSSFADAIAWCDINAVGKVFVIGGEQVFGCCSVDRDNIHMMYITCFKYDTPLHIRDKKYFPNILENFQEIYSESKHLDCIVMDKKVVIDTDFKIFQNNYTANLQEREYLKLLNKISNINLTESRNSLVSSSFGERLIFDLTEGFPLLTSKHMGFKTILRELLWFISGSTCNKKLNEMKVHIWDQNASDDYMKSRGLNYEAGDLGPIYGFQWRHFGAEYISSDTDYNDKGVDQLKYIIDTIKNNPSSRRIIMSAWNPGDLDKMALPPCHVMCQFNVDQVNNQLNCQLYQRSGDMFLGVPFNIASYALLTHIIAHLTGYKVGKLIHILGDAHIYNSHMNAIQLQLQNPTYQFPKLIISDDLIDIDKIDESYFKINDYKSCGRINAQMIS